MQHVILELLQKHQLRKTSIRRQVLAQFLEAEPAALGNSELEKALPKADRITLYRTLRTFEEKGLIHQAIDGSGSNKYALCKGQCGTHAHQDDHAHFRCLRCDQTICLDASLQSEVQVPLGFRVQQSHLVLEGICSNCNHPEV